MTDDIVIEVPTMTRCSACFTENTEKECWNSDCKCYDLTFCSDCWKEWICKSAEKRYEQHENTQIVIRCTKCNVIAFYCKIVNPNFLYDNMCIFFILFLGYCSLISTNVIIFMQSDLHIVMYVFVILFDMISIYFTVNLFLKDTSKPSEINIAEIDYFCKHNGRSFRC